MEPLRIEQTDDSPQVELDQESGRFEISGKSLPEDVVDFYQPVLDWLGGYRSNPNPKTEFCFKLLYFNTASSKLILDIMMVLEEMTEEGNDVVIQWHSIRSDEDMQDIGAFYEKQTVEIGTAAADKVEMGQRIYRGGNGEGVPACMGCHGPSGAGNPSANFPAVSGQHAAYTAKALKDFRSAARGNDMNNMMRDIARKMSDEEIAAVAEYISGLH